MERIYKGLCASILAVMLLTFLVAVFDKEQGVKPEITISALLDGSYIEDFQFYFADTFPGKESMSDDLAKLEDLYGFGTDSGKIE